MQWLKNNFKHLPTAIFANLIYSFPSKKLNLIGVTGTDGKTTVSLLVHHILNYAGVETGVISTIGAKIREAIIPIGFHVTSPNPMKLQKFLKKMVDQNIKWAVLEATSHGLDQHRFWGVKFKIGIFTNLTHEHLDYHLSLDQYLRAKLKLLKRSQIVVINKDDPFFEKIINDLKGYNKNIITFAINQSAQLRARNIKLTLKGTYFTLIYNSQKIKIHSPLIGKFNVYNQLAAAGATLATGLTDLNQLKEALESFISPKGRMEKIPNKKGIKIFIDFAHTPSALKQTLTTLKKIYQKGKLIVVFGCAGLRDKRKRQVMGKIAAKLADIVVLTSEDPRTENPLSIINQIAQGCKKAGMQEQQEGKSFLGKKGYYIIENRQAAINFTLRNLAEKNDLVLLAGKGHEQSICYGKIEYPWSEHQAVKIALSQK